MYKCQTLHYIGQQNQSSLSLYLIAHTYVLGYYVESDQDEMITNVQYDLLQNIVQYILIDLLY